MQKIRAQFPATSHAIYCNTAAYGLLSETLMEWRQEHDLDFLVDGSLFKVKSLDNIAKTKDVIASFLSCDRARVALVPNFSFGLNILLEGLDRNHRVLLLEEDYPSLNWPFETRGFQISTLRITENLEADIREKVAKENISVLALSIVQWLNGVKIDLDFLKVLKHEFPDLLIIADGTQFCGTSNFSFKDSGIDVFGASGYKWLLAGSGNGFMLVREGLEDEIQLKTVGFNSVGGNLEANKSFRFSKHFEPGHLDSLSFGSLKYALEFLAALGMDSVETCNAALISKAKSTFTELNLLEQTVVLRKDHSNIFNIKGDDQMFQHLVNNNVVCSQRGKGIRLSFHLYNTEEEIEEIAKILKKAL